VHHAIHRCQQEPNLWENDPRYKTVVELCRWHFHAKLYPYALRHCLVEEWKLEVALNMRIAAISKVIDRRALEVENRPKTNHAFHFGHAEADSLVLEVMFLSPPAVAQWIAMAVPRLYVHEKRPTAYGPNLHPPS
jgi:hypothetical protein